MKKRRAKAVHHKARKVNPVRKFLEKWGILTAVAAAVLISLPFLSSRNQVLSAKIGEDGNRCSTIQSGTLKASDGTLIKTGYDKWGYNYQAHMFNGKYCDAYRGASWCQPWKEDNLEMKWNDAWLSNMDCDGDKLLDRHYGFNSYIDSGAWLTNHQSGKYTSSTGKECNWTYFVKIIAAPADATMQGDNWLRADGTKIGPVIWGEFAIIEEGTNDPCAGVHGKQIHSPAGAGFGVYKK